ARLTYDQVAQYLEGDSQAITEDREVRKSINTLFQLYQVLKSLRAERHAMEFETVETYMTFDELGGIKEILPRSRNDAHKLIEECMLLANVAAAEYALKNEMPMLYRVHEPPEFSRIQKVRDFVKLLGLNFPEQPTQKDYQAVIEATKERIDAPSIHAVLLRSMMQAYYGASNAGHYGLAYEAYTHFTSPIRRYPDLLLHRAIKAHLNNKPSPLSGGALDEAGDHFSATERRADEASRSVTTWLKCHYMQQHL
ncbi:RNB domain-containing ribonuclease, partial [Salmonella enterica subsp. enterica serovar Enteritidis]|nr:RNB domain-containing ribonuclease [Salmonella enterica subsp. enterica serovar Enteritidis]